MPALYRIRLTSAERNHLKALIRKGTGKARTLARARVLLLADRGLRDPEIALAVDLHPRTITRLRRRAVEEGIEPALVDRSRPGAARRLGGKQEARLIALACSDPPTGHAGWTMQLLADRLVELEVVDAISAETVRRTLKKTRSSPGALSSGASRPSARPSSLAWKRSSICMPRPTIPRGRLSVSMNVRWP